jgi:hypothetical protein
VSCAYLVRLTRFLFNTSCYALLSPYLQASSHSQQHNGRSEIRVSIFGLAGWHFWFETLSLTKIASLCPIPRQQGRLLHWWSRNHLQCPSKSTCSPRSQCLHHWAKRRENGNNGQEHSDSTARSKGDRNRSC